MVGQATVAQFDTNENVYCVTLNRGIQILHDVTPNPSRLLRGTSNGQELRPPPSIDFGEALEMNKDHKHWGAPPNGQGLGAPNASRTTNSRNG